jgi:signal transduction histidine kinase
MQNGIQNLQKHLSKPFDGIGEKDVSAMNFTLDEINGIFGDFIGWVLVSTLDDLDEAKKNCAPGRVDIQSKLIREKRKKNSILLGAGVKLDISGVSSLVIETYIQYFEQIIDLVLSNAVKYSARAGTVEVFSSKVHGGVRIQIDSIGPHVMKSEIASIGEKGFRCDSAKRMHVTGNGFGLFNVKLLARLLGASVDFRPGSKISFNISGVPFSSFSVVMVFPDSVVR